MGPILGPEGLAPEILRGSEDAGLAASGVQVAVVWAKGLRSSSFWGSPSRILNINHKKELLWSLWLWL